MSIEDEDRICSWEIFDRVDRHVRDAAVERVQTEQRRLNLESQPTKPVLGEYVRRFAPLSETRATKPSATTAANKHRARLSDALSLESIPATTAVLNDLYSDGYEAGGTDDQDPDQSGRLGDLLAQAGTYAAALVGWMANNAIDPSDKASQVADEASAQGATSANLDDIEANGGSQFRWVLDDDKACQDCQDAEGVHDLADDAPPAHPGCFCVAQPVGDS